MVGQDRHGTAPDLPAPSLCVVDSRHQGRRLHRMTDEPPTDPELDAIVAELVQAGLVTIGTDADSRETWTLTPAGEQVANQIAMSAEDDGVALLTALLNAAAS